MKAMDPGRIEGFLEAAGLDEEPLGGVLFNHQDLVDSEEKNSPESEGLGGRKRVIVKGEMVKSKDIY